MSDTLKDTGCKPQSHGEARPGGGPCPRCKRARCTAAAKTRPGERCRKNPHPGATICTNHGLTEAGRAAAAAKVTEEKAEAALTRMLLWNPDAPPVEDSVTEMRRMAGSLSQAVNVLGSRLSGGVCEFCGRVAEPLDGTTAAAWLRAIREQRQLLSDMERLGLAEQVIELEQGKAQLVTSAFVAAVAAVGSLLPADKDLMLRTFLTGLGRGPEQLEAGGGAS